MNAFFRFLSAVGYYGSLKFLWGSERIRQAADETFTSSAEAIGMAFDIQQDADVKSFQTLRNGVGKVELILEEKRETLGELNAEEQKLLTRREGIATAIEHAEAAGNAADLTEAKAAWDRNEARLKQIDEQQEQIEGIISTQEKSLAGHFATLTKLQARIQSMSAEKAEAVAEFVSLNALNELEDQLNGIKVSMESGPLNAVQKKIKDLRGQARVNNKLRGADVNVQDAKFDDLGAMATSSQSLDAFMAARKAKKAAETGSTEPAEKAERPKI